MPRKLIQLTISPQTVARYNSTQTQRVVRRSTATNSLPAYVAAITRSILQDVSVLVVLTTLQEQLS